MIFGFTGTRKGMKPPQRDSYRTLLSGYQAAPGSEFHHGDCVGADMEADHIARDLGFHIVIHPPTDPTLRAFCSSAPPTIIMPAKPYHQRNRNIVTAVNRLIATPKTAFEEQGGGTWYTIRYARQYHLPLAIIYPQGAVAYERWL